MINPDKVVIPYNYVLLEVNKPMQDKIKFNDRELILDTSFNPGKHTTTSAKVMSVCKKIAKGKNALEWTPQIEVKPGDEIICEYLAILLGFGRKAHKYAKHESPLYFEYDGKYYVFVKYTSLYMKGDQMLNGYVLFEKQTKEEIFFKHKISKMAYKGKALAVGKKNLAYKLPHQKDADIEVGDNFFFRPGGHLKLEPELHEKNKRNYYIVQRKWIIAKHSV